MFFVTKKTIYKKLKKKLGFYTIIEFTTYLIKEILHFFFSCFLSSDDNEEESVEEVVIELDDELLELVGSSLIINAQ